MLSAEVHKPLRALQPEAAERLGAILGQARDVTDEKLLALCAGYVEAALHCRDWEPPVGGLSEKERAFIDFTAGFVMSVSTLEDAAVARLLEFASADEVYAFVHALYVTDMALRLDMVGREVLA